MLKKYRDKNQGRHDFQIDLGISLLNYGIGLDWDGESRERPSYMRKGAFKPCECKMCFFCVKGLTNGITHQPSKGAKVIVEYACGMRVKMDKKCTSERVDLGFGYQTTGQEKKNAVPNIKNGMSHLQGADLQRVLGRGV
jgi:hypothetical protein